MSKRFILPLSALAAFALAVLALAPAYAQEPAEPKAEEASAAREIKGEVVSVDAEAKTITLKQEAAEADSTLTVEGKALASLKDCKAGDKVVLKCKAAEGEGADAAAPCVVTDIEAPAPPQE